MDWNSQLAGPELIIWTYIRGRYTCCRQLAHGSLGKEDELGCYSFHYLQYQTVVNKKAVLSQGNRAMPRVIYSTWNFGMTALEQIGASLPPDSKDSRLMFV